MMNCYKNSDVKMINDRVGIPYIRLHIYLYLIDGMLVDTGPAIRRKLFLPVLLNEHIESVVITHLHEDHAGLAYDLQKNLSVPIYLHKNSITEATQDAKVSLYRRMFWGLRRRFIPTPIPHVVTTNKYSFNVIETPGHRNDHIMLFEKNCGWLFTGDLFVSPKQNIAFIDDNVSQHITSLEKIMQLDFDTIFCAHAGVRENGKKLIQVKLDYFYTIREQVRKYRLLGMGDKEITKLIFPKKKAIQYISGGDWSAFNLVKTIE